MKCFENLTLLPFKFRKRLRIKHFAELKTLDDRERDLAIEMPTLRMAHVDRERENTPAKQHMSKA
jgi:hypothetical protein